MNRAYRLIRNAATSLLQAVSEIARSTGNCGEGG